MPARPRPTSPACRIACSAAILAIDLEGIAAIEAAQGGPRAYDAAGFPSQRHVFDLPTLDDPTRATDDGAGEPFGGNDGLNQAKLASTVQVAVADGTVLTIPNPVGVYSSGSRNPYDVLVTEDGKLLTYDNGANAGWVGLPVDAKGGRYTGAAGQLALTGARYAAAQESFEVEVTDGTLDLSFRGMVDQAKLSGVVVRQVCGEPPPPPPLPGGARLLVHADSNEIAGTSTFTDGAFALTNTSDQEITRVTLDLRSMALPDVVFDPTGTAGNDLGKGFDIKQSGGTGVTTPYLAEGSPPFGAPLGNGGYQTLTIDVADFDAGETLTVSVDTDPISVEGAAPGGAGFVNGVALPGATVTVTYADGTTHVGQVMGDGSLAGGEVFLRASLALALTLDVGGIGGGETGELLGIRQALSISGGPAGATVRVQLIHGDLIPDVPPGPVRDPLTQANAAVDVD